MKHLILILSLALISVACDNINPDDPKKAQAVTDKKDISPDDLKKAQVVLDKYGFNSLTDSNSVGNNVLIEAVKNNDFESTKILVNAGADVNISNQQIGSTPLRVASYNGFFEIVKYLVENGADVNASSDKGWAPIHVASRRNQLEIVKYLVENGADVNAKTNDGETPLSQSKTFYFFDNETTDYLESVGAR